jgi:hypothetical protein
VLDITDTGTVNIKYEATVDNYYEIKDYRDFQEVPVSKFDPAVLTYLNPSRYCQSDKLYRLANNTFGEIDNTLSRL